MIALFSPQSKRYGPGLLVTGSIREVGGVTVGGGRSVTSHSLWGADGDLLCGGWSVSLGGGLEGDSSDSSDSRVTRVTLVTLLTPILSY